MTIEKQNVINHLTPTQLQAVEAYAEGMTYPQLADHLSISQNAVWWRLRRARTRLQADSTEQLCHSLGLGCIGHKPTLNGGVCRA